MGLEIKILLTFLLFGIIIPCAGAVTVHNNRLQQILTYAMSVWVFVAVVGAFFFIWSL